MVGDGLAIRINSDPGAERGELATDVEFQSRRRLHPEAAVERAVADGQRPAVETRVKPRRAQELEYSGRHQVRQHDLRLCGRSGELRSPPGQGLPPQACITAELVVGRDRPILVKVPKKHERLGGMRALVEDGIVEVVAVLVGRPVEPVAETIVQLAGCYSEDTRALTKNGLKLFNEIKKNDYVLSINPKTKNIEYKKIKRIIIDKYTGKMIHFKSRSCDLLVTPNHNMLL